MVILINYLNANIIQNMWALIFVTLLCTSVQGLTDEELKAEFTKIMMQCMQTNPVEVSDLMQMQKLVLPKSMEAKCLLACAYKTEGTLNDKGLYDKEHAYKVAELAKNGDEKRLENGKKIADICAKVNDVQVSDGEKGCERSGLIFKCVTENAVKFGFKV